MGSAGSATGTGGAAVRIAGRGGGGSGATATAYTSAIFCAVAVRVIALLAGAQVGHGRAQQRAVDRARRRHAQRTAASSLASSTWMRSTCTTSVALPCSSITGIDEQHFGRADDAADLDRVVVCVRDLRFGQVVAQRDVERGLHRRVEARVDAFDHARRSDRDAMHAPGAALFALGLHAILARAELRQLERRFAEVAAVDVDRAAVGHALDAQRAGLALAQLGFGLGEDADHVGRVHRAVGLDVGHEPAALERLFTRGLAFVALQVRAHQIQARVEQLLRRERLAVERLEHLVGARERTFDVLARAAREPARHVVQRHLRVVRERVEIAVADHQRRGRTALLEARSRAVGRPPRASSPRRASARVAVRRGATPACPRLHARPKTAAAAIRRARPRRRAATIQSAATAQHDTNTRRFRSPTTRCANTPPISVPGRAGCAARPRACLAQGFGGRVLDA